ncbi:MAG: UDP-N-acetylmuramate--L-alanine ligase, partial [Bacteroidetes bacterium]
ISVNYNTNFWSSSNNVCVIEADEYDRSFLKLSPNIAVITSTDADHLDIYGTHEAVEDAFVQFAERIDASGLLIRKHGIKKLDGALLKRQLTYTLHPASGHNSCQHHEQHEHDEPDVADMHADNITNKLGGYSFDVMMHQKLECHITLPIGGLHNVENTLAAYGVAKALGISQEKIWAAIAEYKGVKRRFEYIIKKIPQQPGDSSLVFIDDYAHHPTEITALLQSAKQMFPTVECTILFQPHLYTRTRDFAQAFGEALSLADHVLLMPIYPARELPIAGVDSNTIAQYIPTHKVQLVDTTDGLHEHIKTLAPQLFITAGAGNIDTLIESIAHTLKTIHA